MLKAAGSIVFVRIGSVGQVEIWVEENKHVEKLLVSLKKLTEMDRSLFEVVLKLRKRRTRRTIDLSTVQSIYRKLFLQQASLVFESPKEIPECITLQSFTNISA
jgi:hypothetical protein